MGPHTLSLSLYADDTAFLYSHSEPQELVSAVVKVLSRMSTYFKSWDLKMNTGKAQIICFFCKYVHIPHLPVFFVNNYLEWLNVVRYLDLYLDRRLT